MSDYDKIKHNCRFLTETGYCKGMYWFEGKTLAKCSKHVCKHTLWRNKQLALREE